ncbi:hypothetical protein AURDEDRAFT_112201 [Auricularia subglabra TFB-10046 SS5]|nr:hypothetical protein AURDEDRAFT_112201 [Auricularia subglabra TFB-10046 SS5]
MLARLTRLFGLPGLSLDKARWEPGWVQAPREVFYTRVKAFIDSHDEWVMDGNAMNSLGGLPAEHATDIIWLDPPFVLYFPRVFWRTIKRLFGWGEPCAPGCDETWRLVFWNRESILLWVITQHRRVRVRNSAALAADPAERGGKWRRLGGWGFEAKRWFQHLQELVKSR